MTYVSWLRCYIANRFTFVCIYVIYSTLFEVLFGVSEGSVMGS